MRLKDKVALITGAGSGIGRQAALLFSREGAAIVAVDVNEKAAQETVGMIQNAIAVKADVSKALSDLAWQPTTALADGLRAQWEWAAARVGAA